MADSTRHHLNEQFALSRLPYGDIVLHFPASIFVGVMADNGSCGGHRVSGSLAAFFLLLPHFEKGRWDVVGCSRSRDQQMDGVTST